MRRRAGAAGRRYVQQAVFARENDDLGSPFREDDERPYLPIIARA
jgi:hypothetical protein